jgi:hypothetical protein
VRVLDVQQGSLDWQTARLGIPTASRFDKILTPKTLKIAAGRRDYMHELLAESLLGSPLDAADTEWMARGREMEPNAVAWYEFQRGIDTEAVGFVLRDDGLVGCSPDRLVGPDGGLEVKCRGPKAHVACLLGDEPAVTTQVQGCLWLCERDWWDVLGHHENLPPVLTRVHRDEKVIEALAAAVDQFTDELAEARRKIDALGNMGRTDSLESLLAASLELVP